MSRTPKKLTPAQKREFSREIRVKLNEKSRAFFDTKIAQEFGIKTSTTFSFTTMRVVTVKRDGSNFTVKQKAFLHGLSEGYAEAMNTAGVDL